SDADFDIAPVRQCPTPAGRRSHLSSTLAAAVRTTRPRSRACADRNRRTRRRDRRPAQFFFGLQAFALRAPDMAFCLMQPKPITTGSIGSVVWLNRNCAQKDGGTQFPAAAKVSTASCGILVRAAPSVNV